MGINKDNKSQGFPVQVVFMTILGIVIFTMGLMLFGRIFSGGEEFSDNLGNQLRTNIDENYCTGENYLCAPTFVLRGDDSDVKSINLVNLGESTENFKLIVELDNFDLSSGIGEKNDPTCGTLNVQYLTSEFTVESGKSAQIPIAFSKNNVLTRPCSFTTVAYIQGLEDESKIPIIVRIE